VGIPIPKSAMAPGRGQLTWDIPEMHSDSKGAEVTEWVNTHQFIIGQLLFVRLSEEVPRYQMVDGQKINYVALAVRSTNW